MYRPEVSKHILIYGMEKTPLLVHEEALHRLEITHGCHRTIINLPKDTVVKFVMNFTGNVKSPNEKFIRNGTGRIVASYLPGSDTIIVRHQKKVSCIMLPPGTMFQVSEEYRV